MKRTLVRSRMGIGGAHLMDLDVLLNELKPKNAVLQGGLAKAQGTPDMTIAVPEMLIAIGTTVAEVRAGNSGALTAATAGKKKMAILEVGVNGTVDIIYGAEVAAANTPAVPATSVGHAKICEIGPIAADTVAIDQTLINNTGRDMSR